MTNVDRNKIRATVLEQAKQDGAHYIIDLVISVYEAALSEIDKCEPLGYLCESPDKVARIFVDKPLAIHSHTNTPLYTSPQPRDCEPVAWRWFNKHTFAHTLSNYAPSDGFPDNAIDIEPLYTSPQPRDWVGLSDSRLDEIYDECNGSSTKIYAAIQGELKQLNTKG